MTVSNQTREKDYSLFFEDAYERANELKKSGQLYEASRYILDLKGKRIRPMLVLMAADMFYGDTSEAIYPALTVEFFHNSTLVHDDIMDASDLRRGKPAVHKMYGTNTAINSGNLLTSFAYKFLLNTNDEHFNFLFHVFNRATIEIMEGQSRDLEFETRLEVSESEYLKMIEQKTSVLLAASLQMGAIVGDATMEDQGHMYNFGKYLGLAFQVKDDYLDAFGDVVKVGKIKGGDILNNKKTLLYIKAMENASDAQKKELTQLINETDPSIKIKGMLELYQLTGAKQYTLDIIASFSERSKHYLRQCSVDKERMQPLLHLAADLMNRDF